MNSRTVVHDAHAAVLRVTGEDAFAYLQSQFSNDLRPAATSPSVVYGLWLTRKGKVVADSLVARLAENDYLIVSYHTPADALEAKVSENIIADDVTIERLAWGSWTFAGAGAAAALRACGLPVPTPVEWVAETTGAVVLSGRRGGEAYEVVATGACATMAACIRNMTTPLPGGSLESVRVAHGVPRVPEDCGGGDLPQEAGLEGAAVSFDKGCYLGQEVMARLKAQGRPTRRLIAVEFSVVEPIAAHAKLYAGEVEVGEVRSQATVGGCRVAMAMVRERALAGSPAFAFTPGGPPMATVRASV